MSRHLTAALALLSVGCAHHPDGPQPPRDTCHAERVQDLIGQPRSDTLAEAARRRARATTVRYVEHDRIITTEYRYGRLTLSLDAAGRIARINCG